MLTAICDNCDRELERTVYCPVCFNRVVDEREGLQTIVTGLEGELATLQTEKPSCEECDKRDKYNRTYVLLLGRACEAFDIDTDLDWKHRIDLCVDALQEIIRDRQERRDKAEANARKAVREEKKSKYKGAPNET